LPRLFVRHFLKFLCGGLSLLYVPFAPRAEAIHDRFAGTVVVHDGAQQPVQPLRPARGSVRRLLWAFAWASGGGLIALVIVTILFSVFFPNALEARGDEAEVVSALFSIAILLVEAPILVLAFAGQLPGTREASSRAEADSAA